MTIGESAPSAAPDERETRYIAAMSRPSIVQAYTQWSSTSEAEDLAINRFLPPNPRVLDLGCGAGRMLDAFGSRFATYIGIDGSEEMVAAAKSKHPSHAFEIADIAALKVEPGSFDVALLMHNVIDGLCPYSRRKSVLEIAYASLVADGILVCSSHIRQTDLASGYFKEDYHGMEVSNYRSSPSEFCHEVEDAGFDVRFLMQDKRESFSDWMYIVGIRKI